MICGIMRRILPCLFLALILGGCGANVSPPRHTTESAAPSKAMKGVWIAYYELNFQKASQEEFAERATEMMRNVSLGGFNTVFCHVRPYCDAIYPSKIFPWSNAADRSLPQGTDPGYDPLQILISAAREQNLEFHAWLNPYRVATAIPNEGEVWQTLAENHPARIWLTDADPENDRFILETAENSTRSLYLNPAEEEVIRLVADGIREILENYDVDGIHFDDYFYPTTDPDFDKKSYTRYLDSGGTEELGQWRRGNVNLLVQTAYSVAHRYNRLFGISPAAAISADKTDRNYTELYADLPLWISHKGYLDYVIPQLYFGYEYPLKDYRFPALMERWLSLPRLDDIEIYIGLGAYKQGSEDAGSREWQTENDIIFRQSAEALRRADGYVIFSYSSLWKQ